MSTFDMATALERTGGSESESSVRFLGSIPDGWQQGKGAFGGLVVGMMARAFVEAESDPSRVLRAVNADLLVAAPPGPVEVVVSVLRRGGSVSFLEAHLSQGDTLIARANGMLGAARAIDRSPAAGAQPLPPLEPQRSWTDAPVLPVEPPLGPVFAQHYEYRSRGPLPFSGGATIPVATGWIRARTPPAKLDEAHIVGLLDAWWPTTLTVDTRPRATVTVGYTAQFVKPLRDLDPREPLFYRAHGIGGGDNYFVEMRELWSGGEVVALNQQTFAILS
jgi:hypothetical protein